MLCPELNHLLSQLIVHVFLNPDCRLLLLLSLFTNNLGLHRASSRECLGDGFALETNNGLCNHGMKHPTSAVPRLCSLFILQTQQLQALGVGFLPILAACLVIVNF